MHSLPNLLKYFCVFRVIFRYLSRLCVSKYQVRPERMTAVPFLCDNKTLSAAVCLCLCLFLSLFDRLVGLVVRRLPREWKIPGSNPACADIFPGSGHTSDLIIGTPVATLPGAWRYRVSAETGRPGVSIL